MLRISRKVSKSELTGRILVALALCAWAGTAQAEPRLQGRWEISMPSEPGFSGEIIIDAEGRAAFSGASVTLGKSIRSRGYISRLTDAKVEITLTAGTTTARMRCAIQSRDVLNCDDIEATGRISDMYFMRRVGPGPVSLLSQ